MAVDDAVALALASHAAVASMVITDVDNVAGVMANHVDAVVVNDVDASLLAEDACVADDAGSGDLEDVGELEMSLNSNFRY